jgi:predicted molibdopterin-dependent oxidoreductase YjgC
MINLTIDGKNVSVEDGKTVLDAAKSAGIYIPTLCYHPILSPYGACRLCIVEIEGRKGFPTACTTPAENGMIVRTNTKEVQKLRKNILSFLLSEHPSSCLICTEKERCNQESIRKVGVTTGCKFCPSNTICELQKVVEYVKPEFVFPILYRNLPVEKHDPFYDRDYNLCILCGRCVRVCNEIRGNGVLSFLYRGGKAKIGTAYNMSHIESDCQFCGACVDVCPTGALSDRISKWIGKIDNYERTVCPYCSIGCGLKIGVKDNRVVKVVPDDDSINQGQSCVRGRFSIIEIVHSNARLKYPLIRKNGILTKASWEEAIELVAENIKKYKGDESSIIFSANCTNEDAFIIKRFAKEVLNTNNIVIWERNNAPFPNCTIEEIGRFDCILVIGANIGESHPIIQLQIKKACDNGAKLIIISPYITSLNRFTKYWIKVYPQSYEDILENILNGLTEEKSSHLDEIIQIIQNSISKVIIYKEYLPQIIKLAKLTNSKLLPVLNKNNERGCYDIVNISLSSSNEGYRSSLVYLIGVDFKMNYSPKFVVVQDMFLPYNVGKIADVVFPSSSFLEIEGTYTNIEGRVQFIRKVIEPIGESKQDWMILSQIAKKLKVEFNYNNSYEILEDIKTKVPYYSGITLNNPYMIKYQLAEELCEMENKKIEIDKNYPILLICEPDPYSYRGIRLTDIVNGLKVINDEGTIEISEYDAKKLNITSLQKVKVVSKKGEIFVKVKINPMLQEGIARMVRHSKENSPIALSDDNICAVRIEM